METMITNHPVADLEALHPSDSTILVRINPASLSQETLLTLAAMAEPKESARELRGWLRGCVANETNRRLLGETFTDSPRKAEAWVIPWHQWNDGELSEALAASYGWFGMHLEPEEIAVCDAIHRAVVCVCVCRLGELHDAIERARK